MEATTDPADLTKKVRLKLNSQERKISGNLSLLFAVRMLGLFLLTPIFADAAKTLVGGNDTALVGAAIGAYGITQAIMQIPLGMASDRFGRRPVVLFGLLLFIIGGIVCANTDDVRLIIVGRAIQGLGAVSAAITAWIADGTRPEVRARAMAMMGGSIGVAFAVSLVLAPVLVDLWKLSGLFWAISILGFVCFLMASFMVPVVPQSDDRSLLQSKASEVLKDSDLLKLNFGVFCLHFILMSIFVVMPPLLTKLGGYDVGHLWQVYLPVILISFVLMVPIVFIAETRRTHSLALRACIALLVITMASMPWAMHSFWGVVLLVLMFFVAFNVLEALQPSMVSRVAHPSHKGLALGFYNMAQALGVAGGGGIGGLIASHYGDLHVFLACTVLAIVWYISSRNLNAEL